MKIRLPYTRTYRDRHGKWRIEYRRRGKTIPLRGVPGTPEFLAEYDRAREVIEGPSPAKKQAGVKDGTLRWLCVQWLASAEYGQLADSTQRDRRRILEKILEEPLRPGAAAVFADCPLARFSPEHVRVLRDRKRSLPDAANTRVKLLRGLFKWALEHEVAGLESNPARDIPRLKIEGDGYHCWTAEEREQFEKHHPVGSKARLAYELIFRTGQRRSDVVVLGRQHVRDGRLCFTQTKNRRRKPISLELPILPELQRVLDASPLGDMTFLVNDYRKPFTVAGFGNKFRDWCNQAGLPAHCSAHGLRKSAATVAAENGATAHELMSIFGWLSLKEAERYTRAAERRVLADRGMGRLVPIKAGTRSV